MAADRYSPAEIESRWYRQWMDERRFAPSMKPGAPPFCIVIPPPNVTGSLHMGHAWDETIQDVLTRWHRMRGFNTLWIPGTDHAGIATQWMVEKVLRAQGIDRIALGREKFLAQVWAFKTESHKTITNQLKRLGVSCDWERERFTLDEGLSRAVRRVFVTLYREGLIYRAERMISWCPVCLTALSDLEVNHKEIEGGLWQIRYPFEDGNGHITVATTRPETLLGDTAVAVHPDDERYRAMIGRNVILPLVDKPIPVIADSYVDPKFALGALKVTPGHDPNDFEIGKRNNLHVVTVMNEDGTMNANVPKRYRDLDRFEARKLVVEDLKALGLLAKHEKHVHSVGTCSRSGTIVEPRVSVQWWVRMKEMAAEAVRAVESKRIELLPEYQEKIFYEWMNNIQDWCISRQLWWGHRIPVWYCHACADKADTKDVTVDNFERVRILVPDEGEDLRACPHCHSTRIHQDPDVLDTWFSSGLWPFSTMGWPERTEDLRTFYPTSVLVTGYDILFFWVARMIMLGMKMMQDRERVEERIPFKQVFLHGLLRDEHGEKMSKTKGNGIDPLEAIDEFGADALRFTLAAQSVMGRDMILQRSTIEGYRNFVNKIWNAHRFLVHHWERIYGADAISVDHGGSRLLDEELTPALDKLKLSLFDRWILGRLEQAAFKANRHLEARRFNEACKELYLFVWYEYCDTYIEMTKPVLLGPDEIKATSALATLRHVLDQSLRLIHPIMPFVTEELWRRLPGTSNSIMVAEYPAGAEHAHDAAAQIDTPRLINFMTGVRFLRSERQLLPKQQIKLQVENSSKEFRELLEGEQSILKTVLGIEDIAFVDKIIGKDVTSSTIVEDVQIAMLVQLDSEELHDQRERLTKDIEKAQAQIVKIRAKLDKPDFVSKAPPAVVEKNREELLTLQTQISKLNETLSQL